MAQQQLDGEQFAALRAQIQRTVDSISQFVQKGEDTLALPVEVRDAMVTGRCFGRALPTAYGGSGSGLREFALQQEGLAGVWPTAAVAATWTNLSGRLIDRFGTSEQKEQWLPRLATGQALGAIAWTEPHTGSDAAATTAERVHGGWRLNGSKRLFDHAGGANFFIVGARSEAVATADRAQSMFVVRRDDPGFEFGGVYSTLGLRAAGVGWFGLRDCFVPDGRMLGEPGRASIR